MKNKIIRSANHLEVGKLYIVNNKFIAYGLQIEEQRAIIPRLESFVVYLGKDKLSEFSLEKLVFLIHDGRKILVEPRDVLLQIFRRP